MEELKRLLASMAEEIEKNGQVTNKYFIFKMEAKDIVARLNAKEREQLKEVLSCNFSK